MELTNLSSDQGGWHCLCHPKLLVYTSLKQDPEQWLSVPLLRRLAEMWVIHGRLFPSRWLCHPSFTVVHRLLQMDFLQLDTFKLCWAGEGDGTADTFSRARPWTWEIGFTGPHRCLTKLEMPMLHISTNSSFCTAEDQKRRKKGDVYHLVISLSGGFMDSLPGLFLASKLKLGCAMWGVTHWASSWRREGEQPTSLQEGSGRQGLRPRGQKTIMSATVSFYWPGPWALHR